MYNFGNQTVILETSLGLGTSLLTRWQILSLLLLHAHPPSLETPKWSYQAALPLIPEETVGIIKQCKLLSYGGFRGSVEGTWGSGRMLVDILRRFILIIYVYVATGNIHDQVKQPTSFILIHRKILFHTKRKTGNNTWSRVQFTMKMKLKRKHANPTLSVPSESTTCQEIYSSTARILGFVLVLNTKEPWSHRIIVCFYSEICNQKLGCALLARTRLSFYVLLCRIKCYYSLQMACYAQKSSWFSSMTSARPSLGENHLQALLPGLP